MSQPTVGDANAAAGTVQPTASTVSDNQIPMPDQTPVTPTAPASAAPTADQVQAAPPVPSSGAPVPPKPQGPQVPQNPADLHQSIYKSILGTLAGGQNRPLKNPDGTPQTNPDGTVKMAPASTKQLGNSILAGALSAMIAGFATPTKYNTFGSGENVRHVADTGAAVAAGAQAAQPFTEEGSKNAAQKLADENSARQMSNVDHNLKMHQLMIANDKADAETQQGTVDDWKELNDTMEQEEAKGGLVDEAGNPIKSIYSARDITPEQLHDMMNSQDPTVHVRADQVAPSKVIQILGPDGNMHPKTLFNVFNPSAMIAMTDELKATHPELQHAVGTIPIRVLATSALNENNSNLAKSGLADQLKAYDEANGTKLADTFDLKASAQKNSIIEKLYPVINKYRSDSLPALFNDIKKDPAFKDNATIQAASAKLQEVSGITSEGLRKQSLKELNDSSAVKKGDEGAPVDAAKLATVTTNMATLHPNLHPDQLRVATTLFHPGMTNKEFKQATDDIDSMETKNIAAKNQTAKLGIEEQKMLVDYGFSGDTRLTLDNAPDPSMIVDSRTGNVVPHKDEKQYAPTMAEKNRADFAHTVLSAMSTLRAMQAAGTLPNGPITGLTADVLAKAGMANADAQKAIGTITLMQTAATGAHVAGRFSLPVLDKMSTLIKLNMNDDQFEGAMQALEPIMQQYSDHGGVVNVSQYRDMNSAERKYMKDKANDTNPWYHPQNTTAGPAVNTQTNINTPPINLLSTDKNNPTKFKNGQEWYNNNGTATLLPQGK